MQGDAVHRRAHAELAHAVEHVIAAAFASDDPGGLHHREVRPGEVGRAAEQLRQRGHQHLEHPLRGLAGRDGLGLLARFLQEERNLLVEITGQLARHPALEFRGFGRVLLLVRGEQPVPAPLGALARLAGVPAAVHVLGDLEGGMAPAERLPGGGNLLVAEWRAVRRPGAGLGRSAFRDDGLGADQRRARLFALRPAQRAVDRLQIVAIDVRDHLPAVRLEAPPHVVGEPLLDLALVRVDRDAVVVINGDQLAQPESAGERAGLVRQAFHHAAVAHEDIGVVIDDRVARAVELGSHQAFSERHADGVRDPLPGRPGGGLDPRRQAALRMARRPGMQLPEAPQLVHRQRVAREVQQAVEQHRAVAVGQHEAVAIRPCGVGRVVAQVAPPERHRDLRHSHGHAGMAGLRRLHGIHRERANRVGELAFRRRGIHRRPQIILGA